jgi:ferredoxin
VSNVYIEQEDDGYVAYQNKKIVAEGDTQMQAAKRARRECPDDPILAERVRNTGAGSRDKWRRIYP